MSEETTATRIMADAYGVIRRLDEVCEFHLDARARLPRWRMLARAEHLGAAASAKVLVNSMLDQMALDCPLDTWKGSM